MQINFNNFGDVELKDDVELTTEKEIAKNPESASQLRQDLITGDWVVIATGRARRPASFADFERVKDDKGIEQCLFEDPVASGQEPDVLIYADDNGDWSLRVFPNKYPTVASNVTAQANPEGPYFSMPGIGFHEIVVTRDHFKHLALLDTLKIAEVFDAFQDRYLDLMNKRNINYIAIFHNYGKEAGASISHPHSQIMAIPVIAPYPKSEIDGAEIYYKQNKQCVFCTMIEHEKNFKQRVVFENEEFVAFCPYASRAAFEVWVLPKKHNPYFERITDLEKISLAKVFGKSLNAIFKALNDPPYNFYINTSPCDGRDYPHFHWHIEILPHTATWAGFELETGIEISTIQPEVAAEFLRKHLSN